MITDEIKKLRNDCSQYSYSAEKLANNVLKIYFNGNPPEFPINIFKMLTDFGVFYEFRDLDKLEGAYSPESDEYANAVMINKTVHIHVKGLQPHMNFAIILRTMINL